jgi:hypothetical protein
MPLNVVYGYIVLDSICKAGSQSAIDSALHAISLDSLSMAMKIYYDIIEYDPILFMEYARASRNHAGYQVDIGTIGRTFLEVYRDRHPLSQLGEALLYTNYIYRVQIVSQSSIIDTTAKLLVRYYCAKARVLDKIKGGVLPDPSREIYSGGEEGNGFINIWWGHVEGNQTGVTIVDSAEYIAVREGYLEPGSEYIVLIDAFPIYVNDTDRGYRLSYSNYLGEYDNFVFPVRSGNVIDVDQYFEIGENIPLQEFIELVRGMRSRL